VRVIEVQKHETPSGRARRERVVVSATGVPCSVAGALFRPAKQQSVEKKVERATVRHG
jgi:hypothetical protein